MEPTATIPARTMTEGDRAAEKVADAQGGQNRGDQRGPGEDAAAEKRPEVARSQHLEAHHNRARYEGDDVNDEQERRRGRLTAILHRRAMLDGSVHLSGLSFCRLPPSAHELCSRG